MKGSDSKLAYNKMQDSIAKLLGQDASRCPQTPASYDECTY